MTNLLGHIIWGNNTTFTHILNFSSEIEIDSLKTISSNDKELKLQEAVEIDSNYAISSFQTDYPGSLIFGLECKQRQWNVATNLRFGFSNELGTSTTPRLSLGGEFHQYNWISLLGGISVGGYESFQWGAGIRMQFYFLRMIFSYSEYGGMFKTAKGFSLAASTSFVL